jgi:hypothetical protein
VSVASVMTGFFSARAGAGLAAGGVVVASAISKLFPCALIYTGWARDNQYNLTY